MRKELTEYLSFGQALYKCFFKSATVLLEEHFQHLINNDQN